MRMAKYLGMSMVTIAAICWQAEGCGSLKEFTAGGHGCPCDVAQETTRLGAKWFVLVWAILTRCVSLLNSLNDPDPQAGTSFLVACHRLSWPHLASWPVHHEISQNQARSR